MVLLSSAVPVHLPHLPPGTIARSTGHTMFSKTFHFLCPFIFLFLLKTKKNRVVPQNLCSSEKKPLLFLQFFSLFL